MNAIELPVQWSDMDAFGHVNNVIYLRWFESGRIAYFEALGVPVTLQGPGARPVLGRATVDFRRAVTYPDTIRIETSVTKIGTTSFTTVYRALSKRRGDVVAEGEGIIVMTDPATGLKTPVTDTLRAAINALESR